MNNGRAIFMIDAVYAEMDSLSYASEFLAYPILDAMGLGDQLFSYGARINTSLIQDLVCAGVNDRRSVRPWVYFLFLPQTEHPIAKNLNAVRMEFATTMDTVRVPGVRKTPCWSHHPTPAAKPPQVKVSVWLPCTTNRTKRATKKVPPWPQFYSKGPYRPSTPTALAPKRR